MEACSNWGGGGLRSPSWSAMPRVMNADHGDGIRFVTRNPKRPRTAAWQRYEQYKVATTVGDALKLGAMRFDIQHDLKHCFASKIRGVAEASLHAAPGAAEASLHAAPSSILAASTDWAAPASSHTSPSVGASTAMVRPWRLFFLMKATRRSEESRRRTCEHSCRRSAW